MGQFYAAPAAPAPRKKKSGAGKKVLISIVSVLAVLGLVVGLAFVIFPKQTKAFMAKTFYSDEKYFKTVEAEGVGDIAKDVASYYETAKDYTEKSSGAPNSVNVTLGINQTILEPIAEQLGIDLGWLSNISFDLKTDIDDDASAAEAAISLSGGKVATLQIRYDKQNEKIYLCIPELSDKFISLSADDVSDLLDSFNFDYMDGISRIGSMLDLGSLLGGFSLDGLGGEAVGAGRDVVNELDGNDIEKLVDRYLTVVINSVENVEKKTETVTVNGVSEELTVFEANITAKDLQVILLNILKEVKGDRDVERIIDTVVPMLVESDFFGGYVQSAEEAKQQIYDSIDEYISQIEAGIDESDEMIKEYGDEYAEYFNAPMFKYTSRVNGDFEVRGRELVLFDKGITIGYNRVENDGKYAFEIKVDLGESDDDYYYSSSYNPFSSLTVSGLGALDGDKFTGDVAVSMIPNGESSESQLLKIKLENFDRESVKSGELNGKITVSLGSGLIDLIKESDAGDRLPEGLDMQMLTQVQLALGFEYKGGAQTFDIAVKVLGQDLLTLKGEAANEKVTLEKSAPSGAVEFNDLQDLSGWINSWDTESFIEGLVKAGVPRELLTKIANSSGSGIGLDLFD